MRRAIQKRPKRVLFVPVDRHLPRDREFRFVSISRSHVLQRVQQFKVFIVALVSELVARHAEDDQVVPVLFLQGVQLNKVPDGRASERRDVVDEDDFALVSAQREVLAVRGRVARATAERLEREVVDGGRGADAHGGARGRAGGARRRGRARERGVRQLFFYKKLLPNTRQKELQYNIYQMMKLLALDLQTRSYTLDILHNQNLIS